MGESNCAGRQNLENYENTLNLAKSVFFIYRPQMHPADKKYPQSSPYDAQTYRTDQCLGEIEV